MECTIDRVTPFPARDADQQFEPKDSNAVAAVMLNLGPVKLRVKLFKNESDQRLWLGMPGRKGKDDKWYDYISFQDQSVKKTLEERAAQLYNSQLN